MESGLKVEGEIYGGRKENLQVEKFALETSMFTAMIFVDYLKMFCG